MGLVFGTTGFWAWSTPMQQTSPKVGCPGLGRYPIYEVNDGTGQEDPDPLTRCFFENVYAVWVKRDKLIPHIIHRIRSLPWVHVTAMVLKPSERSIIYRICSGNLTLRYIRVHIFYIRQTPLSRRLRNRKPSILNQFLIFSLGSRS
jgi:hypothetical protein